MDNIDEIARTIYSSPPGPPNSIQLELEEESANLAQKEGVHNYIFNVLCLLTFKGMERLYGHKNILHLTEEQFSKVCDYVKSYGYELEVLANGTEHTPFAIQKMGETVTKYNISFEKLNI